MEDLKTFFFYFFRVWHDTAIPFKDVVQQFEAWLVQHQLWTGGKLNRAAFVTWQVLLVYGLFSLWQLSHFIFVHMLRSN